MRPVLLHAWNLSQEEAGGLQRELSRRVVTEDQLPEHIRFVAGVDVAYEDNGSRAFAGIAVINVETGRVEEVASAEATVSFPYVPGLLSFRELPVLAPALEKLSGRPDLVICDGQGIAHPRRFGVACHLGMMYDVPAIGCAKTCLVGQARELSLSRGSAMPMRIEGEMVGAVLRTRNRVKPVYVSPGHRISTVTACSWILRMCSRYRIPDPIRTADQMVNRMKREAGL